MQARNAGFGGQLLGDGQRDADSFGAVDRSKSGQIQRSVSQGLTFEVTSVEQGEDEGSMIGGRFLVSDGRGGRDAEGFIEGDFGGEGRGEATGSGQDLVTAGATEDERGTGRGGREPWLDFVQAKVEGRGGRRCRLLLGARSESKNHGGRSD